MTAPVRHPATLPTMSERNSAQCTTSGETRSDAVTQLADAADVVPAAQRSDVEAVGPDPLLVAEPGVVHRGDGDVVTAISQDREQRRRRVLGAARAEAVDDEQQLHRRSPSCHATCRATPSTRVTSGFHASNSAASETSPPVRATSPA